MLSLKNRTWKEFFIEDIANIKSGKSISSDDRLDGTIPYVTSSANNNGVTDFISSSNFIDKNVISVNSNGSIGYSFYHKYSLICSNDCRKLILKSNKNEYGSLFIANQITQQKDKYNYGYKLGSNRLKRQRIMLPITNKEEPDWSFMENYIKQIEYKQKKEYRSFALKKLKDLEYKEIPLLKEKQWKAFEIDNLFSIKIGKNVDGNKVDKNNGKFAYVTRKESNNGIDGFLDYENDYLNKDFPVITIGNETAKPYVQVFTFFTGTKVNTLKPKIPISYYCLIFISQSLEMHKRKYSYSFTINSTRLRKQKILLPIKPNGTPDYEYMEQYIKNVMYRQLRAYLE